MLTFAQVSQDCTQGGRFWLRLPKTQERLKFCHKDSLLDGKHQGSRPILSAPAIPFPLAPVDSEMRVFGALRPGFQPQCEHQMLKKKTLLSAAFPRIECVCFLNADLFRVVSKGIQRENRNPSWGNEKDKPISRLSAAPSQLAASFSAGSSLSTDLQAHRPTARQPTIKTDRIKLVYPKLCK